MVLLANVAGAWAIASVLAGTGLFAADIGAAFTAISQHSVESSFGGTVLKGLSAGWVIALLVWLMPGSGEARFVMIVLLTWLVSLAGFAHIVAGTVDAAYLVPSGQASGGDYLVRSSRRR